MIHQVKDIVNKVTAGDTVWVKLKVDEVRIGEITPIQLKSEFGSKFRFTKSQEVIVGDMVPEVPEYVVEWFEDHKDDLDASIHALAINYHNDKVSDILEWYGQSDNNPIETLVMMKLNGYTTKGWVVESNGDYFIKFDDNLNPYVGDKKSAHIFTDYSKAKAVEILINGDVKPL